MFCYSIPTYISQFQTILCRFSKKLTYFSFPALQQRAKAAQPMHQHNGHIECRGEAIRWNMRNATHQSSHSWAHATQYIRLDSHRRPNNADCLHFLGLAKFFASGRSHTNINTYRSSRHNSPSTIDTHTWRYWFTFEWCVLSIDRWIYLSSG